VFVSLGKRTPMKNTALTSFFILFLIALAGSGCTGSSSPQNPSTMAEESSENSDPSITGTWQLLTVLTIEGEDSIMADYTNGVKGIKMLNDTHFAFFQHDLKKGTDSTELYVSGGGPYTFKDGIYTEHLEYCNFRVYENNTFSFEVAVNGDTLTQRGEEEVVEAGISKYIIETYLRINESGN